MTSSPGTSPSQKYINMLSSSDAPGDNVPIKMADQDAQDVPMIPVQFGDQKFMLVLDTGSGDTWVAGTGIECKSRSARACKSGPMYTKTSTFAAIPNQVFNTSYSDGEYMSGIMATETLTVGNVSVKNQHFGLVDKARWNGDGISSGILGLGFPSITRAYDTSNVKKGANIPYDTLFINMIRQRLVAPYFSIAFNHQGEAPGAFALGGLPGAPIRYSPTAAKTPLQEFAFDTRQTPKYDNVTVDYKIYAVTTDGFTVGNPSSSMENVKAQVVIDSGSTRSYLPEKVIQEFYKAWSVPPKKDIFGLGYTVPCNSKPPKFGVKFNGAVIYFDPKDLIASGCAGCADICVPTIQASVDDGRRRTPSMLSQSFLKNVVAVFDIGAAEMRFYQRIR
jgi:hypothetical protein